MGRVMTSLPPADGYGYLLPSGWMHLDLDPARRQASVRRAVRRRVREEPRLGPDVARLDRLLRRECAIATANGVERVSLLAEADGAGGLASAAVTLVVVSIPEQFAALDAVTLLDALRSEPVADEFQSDPDATSDVVRLSQQEAVRLSWSQSHALGTEPGPGAGSVTSRCWQVAVPWPGRARAALLTLASPCEPLWPLMEVTFDACALTFHWTWCSPGERGPSD